MSISQVSAQQSLRATMAVAAMRNATPASAPTGVTRQPDAVNISHAARALSAARKSASGVQGVSEDRIAALKAAIANGSYSVSSRDLALSMVRAATL